MLLASFSLLSFHGIYSISQAPIRTFFCVWLIYVQPHDVDALAVPTMWIIAQMTSTSNYALCAPNKLFFEPMLKKILESNFSFDGRAEWSFEACWVTEIVLAINYCPQTTGKQHKRLVWQFGYLHSSFHAVTGPPAPLFFSGYVQLPDGFCGESWRENHILTRDRALGMLALLFLPGISLWMDLVNLLSS